MSETLGSQRFTPIRELGSGGFAKATLAVDAANGAEVVLKRPLARTTESAEQLIREFSLVAPISHPGVARALDLIIDVAEGGPLIVFEAIDGVSSEQSCLRASTDAILSWALGLSETLVVLHAQQLVHGDIKPENILVKSNDAPALIDFGLARHPGERGGGTAATAAPETLRGDPTTFESDLFSLGATLYFWLFHRYPFGESVHARLQRLDRPALLPADANISGGLSRLLRALLAPTPSERPSTAVDVSEALMELGATLADPRFASPESRALALPLLGREAAFEGLRTASHSKDESRFFEICAPRHGGTTRVMTEVAHQARLSGRRVVELVGHINLDIASALLPESEGRSIAANLAALRELGPTTVLIDAIGELSDTTRNELIASAEQLDGRGDLAVVVGGTDTPFASPWTVLSLAPLSQPLVGTLARTLLPGPPILPETVRRLWQASSGLPGLVVRLLVLAVQQELAVNRRPGGWDLYELGKKPLPPLDDPLAPARPAIALTPDAERVQEVLATALDGLPLPSIATTAQIDIEAAARGARELLVLGLVRRDAEDLILTRNPSSSGLGAEKGAALNDRLLRELGRCGRTLTGDARARWITRLARHAYGAGRQPLAVRLAHRSITRALRLGRPDIAGALLAEIDHWLQRAAEALREELVGEIALSHSRPTTAEPAFAYAAQLYLARGQVESAAHALSRQARALSYANQPERAKVCAAEALRLATSKVSRAEAFLELAVAAAWRAQFAEAIDCTSEVLALTLPGDPLRRRAHATRGRCLLLIGRFAEAEVSLQEAAREATEAGDRNLLAAVGVARVQLAVRANDNVRVLREAAEVRGLLIARAEASGMALVSTLVSVAAQSMGDLKRALIEAEESARWRVILGQRERIPGGLLRVARVALLLGDLPRAHTLANRALEFEGGNTDVGERLDALRTIAMTLAITGEVSEVAAPAGDPTPPPDSAPLEQRALAAVLDGWRAVARQDRAGAVAALRPFGETLGTQPRLNWFAGEGLALLAWGLALEEPASALSWARTARELADQIGDVDASVFATRAEAEALETQGDRVGAQDLRAALRSRLRDLASRAAGPTFAAAFLARPDRAAFLSEDPLSADNRRLNALYEIVADLNSARSSSIVIGTLLDRALQVVGGERGAVILIGPGGDLEVVQRRDVEEETERDAVRLSKSVLARAHEGEAVLAVDPANDPRFKSANSVAIFAIRAVLCVPLRHKAKVVGALYIDSRDPKRRFNRDDLAFVQALAHHAALALENARAFDRLQAENERLRADLGRRDRLGELIGRSPIMETLFQEIEAAARSDLSVLIGGETGTGKDLVARQIHRLGMTPDGPFVALNCAALPESIIESQLFGHEKGAFTGADRSQSGLIVQAQGGTLFLDEVAELPLAVQAKLLRVLEERVVRPVGSSREIHVQFRLISASHTDLEDAVRAQRFRADLLYRIVVLRLRVPALRERPEDIPLLVRHLLDRLADQFGQLAIKPGLLERLARWSWPGNVRELENVLSRLAVRADSGTIDVETLESDPELRDQFGGAPQGGLLVNNLKDTQRDLIRRALEICDGNRERAAQMLGMSRATLFRKIKEYGLEAAGRRARLRPPGQPPEVSQ